MTATAVRDEMWSLSKRAWEIYGVRPPAKSRWKKMMAKATAVYTAPDGTIDGADLKRAMRSVVNEWVAKQEK